VRNKKDNTIEYYRYRWCSTVFLKLFFANFAHFCCGLLFLTYEKYPVYLDSISSRFNVLDMPISTTAPIDAKTHVWPIYGIAQWFTNQRSLLGHIQAKTWDVFWLVAGYYEHRVNNYKRIIDMHIILVRVIHSIHNSCIKYSTQGQHFNTNYNLNFYYFIVSIYLWYHFFGNYSAIIRQLFGNYSAIIHDVCDVSDDPDGIFACWAQRR
jgi:hypothetical protein